MSSLDGLFNLKDKVAVITGGVGLLGKKYARAFAECGAHPAIGDIDGAAAERLASDIEIATGISVLGGALDVTKRGSIEAFRDAVLGKFGRVDILINNAGISGKVDDQNVAPSFEDYPLSEWEKAYAVNVTGMVLCAQVFGKVMKKQGGGVMVNVSSIYGILSPDQRIYQKEGSDKIFIKPVSYCVQKSAVLNLTRYLATYWAQDNIRVNTLTPGGVFDNQDIEFVRKYSERTPMGRMANTEDMIGPMLFLASDASKYMTGANLIVDGGWSAW